MAGLELTQKQPQNASVIKHIMSLRADQARSSPNSSAAAIDTGRQGDDGADVVGPYAHQRRARRSAAGETSAR